MQDFFTIFLLSLTQGILEFLPVSSSAHLAVAIKMLNAQNAQEIKLFAEMATFTCVLFYFRSIILGNLFSFSLKFFSIICITCVPFIIGFPIIKMGFQNIILFLILGSIVMMLAEIIYTKRKSNIADVNAITYKQAFLVGCFQLLSIFSGFSRSGSTISGGLIVGLNRGLAVKFSFLISLPLSFTSICYDYYKIQPQFSVNNISAFLITLAVACIAIKPCLKFLSKFSLVWIAFYRIIFAIILLFIF